MSDDPDVRERYYGYSYEPYEDAVSSVALDPDVRRNVLILIKRIPQHMMPGMNIAMLVAGYILYTRLAPGHQASQDDLEECYDVLKYKCADKDRSRVYRTIVRYYLFVKHTLDAV